MPDPLGMSTPTHSLHKFLNNYELSINDNKLQYQLLDNPALHDGQSLIKDWGHSYTLFGEFKKWNQNIPKLKIAPSFLTSTNCKLEAVNF